MLRLIADHADQPVIERFDVGGEHVVAQPDLDDRNAIIIDGVDYEFQPSVDRKSVEDLATLRFIDENRPIGGSEASAVFFQVVNTHYERGHPTLVTANRGLPDWRTIFGDTVVAAAVLDRLTHNAIVFNIERPQLSATRAQRPRDPTPRTQAEAWSRLAASRERTGVNRRCPGVRDSSRHFRMRAL